MLEGGMGEKVGWREGVSILHRVTKEGLSEKVTFET